MNMLHNEELLEKVIKLKKERRLWQSNKIKLKETIRHQAEEIERLKSQLAEQNIRLHATTQRVINTGKISNRLTSVP